MARLLIRSGERRQVFAILDDEFTLGAGPNNVLRLDRPGVEPTHLRFFLLGDDRVRVEPAVDEAELRVGGRSRRAHMLSHGDRIDVADVALAFWEDGCEEPEVVLPEPSAGEVAAAPAGLGIQIQALPGVTRAPVPIVPAPGMTRAPKGTGPLPSRRAVRPDAAPRRAVEDEARRPAAASGPSSRMIRWNAAVAAVALGLVLHRCLGGPGELKSVTDLVRLAETQRASGAVDDARATLEMALAKGPTPEEVARIHRMRRTLDVAEEVRAEQDARDRAFRDLDQLRRFATRHLSDDPPLRPAAREGLALCGAWVDEHRATARADDAREWLDEVEALAARCRVSAAANEPDEAADVLFRAQRRARFLPRHYPDAVRVLSAWLDASAADAPGRAEVEAERDRFVVAGRAEFESEMRRLEPLLASDEVARAAAELRALIERAGMPDWDAEARRRLASLEAGR
ncbi:MAG: FHA domain-containing protein [Planctomycetota bacterium]|nr:FHA domain-containing protein [Planctomycetota bacterium]